MRHGCNCDSEVTWSRKDAYSVFLYIVPSRRAHPPHPSSHRFLPFLVLSLRYIAEIYGLFARNARRRRSGRVERGRFDKSLLVKRPPDCRERDGRREERDLRPMAEFLSDADCSRLLWMVIGRRSLLRGGGRQPATAGRSGP